jgi:hypothetical protein
MRRAILKILKYWRTFALMQTVLMGFQKWIRNFVKRNLVRKISYFAKVVLRKMAKICRLDPEGVYTIVDPYGFTKSLFTIASAFDFLWGRGMVHCRLLAV